MFSHLHNVTTISGCEVCGDELPKPNLDLGLQPLCDDLIPLNSVAESKKYPTQIATCLRCLTSHQLHRVGKELLFPSTYHYRPRFTQDVLNGMQDLVAECEMRFFPVAGKLVCDIGCNDGSLLSFFRDRRAITAGIEPTGACDDAIANGHRAFKEYLSVVVAQRVIATVGWPDVVTFTNVFAHIDSLADAIASLKAMICERTLLVIENHYLGSVIARNQFDTFYHEHPRTYSFRSFEFIARRLGGEVLHVSFPRRYGGNIRVFIGNFGGLTPVVGPTTLQPSGPEGEDGFIDGLSRMQTFVGDWQRETKTKLETLGRRGIRLYGKSFPGRASILLNLLEFGSDTQPMIFEKPASPKIGYYAPGTRIEIASDELWLRREIEPKAMLIWAWHISEEVGGYMRANGYRGHLYAPLPTFHEIL